jgi:phosphate:Na+ symporter
MTIKDLFMAIEMFKDVIAPVVGGLGIFMLGLMFMEEGIQAMAVNKMRGILAKFAGNPVKGLLAGTLITGVIQSSTAMTVMTVGLVNSGILALRPAIAVVMGANIGTTLTNSLIAMPLGLYGLFVAGIAALVYVFSKAERVRNIALAVMGFALIFYGLSMMTGGLKPLKALPEFMDIIKSLDSNTLVGLLTCVFSAAFITAMIHSSSATIGIVMGLGASGVLDWQTCLAFSLGADLGTTITSFIASLNLSRNAKRTAYAHIAFNFIGVAIMLPLFPVGLWLVESFLGNPGEMKLVDGVETYPLIPIAVGIYSTAFNIFNTAVLFPFIGVFERYLLKIGHNAAEDKEDYSIPKFLTPALQLAPETAIPAVQKEINRYMAASGLFMATARGLPEGPEDSAEHHDAVDILSREIRQFTAGMFDKQVTPAQADLYASLIEEADFAASLGANLYQICRRIERVPFSDDGRKLVNDLLDRLGEAVAELDMSAVHTRSIASQTPVHLAYLLEMRHRCLQRGAELPALDRGAFLALLGSAERAFQLIERIDAERRSVERPISQGQVVRASAGEKVAPAGVLVASPV